MADKLIYIPNMIILRIYFGKIQLEVETFGDSTYWTNQQNLVKVPKVVGATNKKSFL